MMKLIILHPENDYIISKFARFQNNYSFYPWNFKKKVEFFNDIYLIVSIYTGSPNRYNEAISYNNKNYWINGIKKNEVNNLYSNKITTFVSKVPPGKKY